MTTTFGTFGYSLLVIINKLYHYWMFTFYRHYLTKLLQQFCVLETVVIISFDR